MHFLNAFSRGNETFPKGSSQNEIVPVLVVFHLPYSKYKGVKMFLLVWLSKSKFSTRVALMSFVQHSCLTCVTLVSLVSHPCCTRVARVSLVLHLCRSCHTRVDRAWHSSCNLAQIVQNNVLRYQKQVFNVLSLRRFNTIAVRIVLRTFPEQK